MYILSSNWELTLMYALRYATLYVVHTMSGKVLNYSVLLVFFANCNVYCILTNTAKKGTNVCRVLSGLLCVCPVLVSCVSVV